MYEATPITKQNIGILHKQLTSFIDALIHRYEPEKIILFGSLLKGEANQSSDVDLLVIKDTNTKRLHRRAEALQGMEHPPVDIIILTPAELEYLISRDAPFIKDIVSNGRVLYDREKSMV